MKRKIVIVVLLLFYCCFIVVLLIVICFVLFPVNSFTGKKPRFIYWIELVKYKDLNNNEKLNTSTKNWFEDELNAPPSENKLQENTQKLLIVLTDLNGNNIDTRIIDGDIKNRTVIEQFAKNLEKNNPGYSYLGGTWNNLDQFLGVLDTPVGEMLLAIRVAD